MDDQALPWAVGCRCGGVRFAVIASQRLWVAHHCAGCRAMTASAFSLTLAIPAEGFAVTEGVPVSGGPQGPTRHLFCPRRLSWGLIRPEGMGEIVALHAILLDEHA